VFDSTVPLRARHLLARIALAQGRLDACERHARAILAVRPAFGPARLTLAEAMLARGDLAAFDAVIASIVASPETPTAQAMLAGLRAMHDGDAAGALAIVDAALARDPASTYLRRVHVFALMGAGRPEAREALERFLRAYPLDLEAQAARRRLYPSRISPAKARSIDGSMLA
jgi:predicted Zn-dependent protease